MVTDGNTTVSLWHDLESRTAQNLCFYHHDPNLNHWQGVCGNITGMMTLIHQLVILAVTLAFAAVSWKFTLRDLSTPNKTSGWACLGLLDYFIVSFVN